MAKFILTVAIQKQEFQSNKRETEINQENLLSINIENKGTNNQVFNIDTYTVYKQVSQPSKLYFNQENNKASSSLISYILSDISFLKNTSPHEE